MLRLVQSFALAILACLWSGESKLGQQVQSMAECACGCDTPAVPACACDGPTQKTNTPCKSGPDTPAPVRDRVQAGKEALNLQGTEPECPRKEPDAWPALAQLRSDAHDAAMALQGAGQAGPGPESSSTRLARLAVFRI